MMRRWPVNPAACRALLCFQVALLALASAPAAKQAGAQEVERPVLKPHRFDEDWRPLCDPARQTMLFDPLKCIPLDSDGFAKLTIGGELRERFEAVHNPGFGLD